MTKLLILFLISMGPGLAGYAVARWCGKWRAVVVPVLLAVIVLTVANFVRDQALEGILVCGVCLLTGYAIGRIVHDDDVSESGFRRMVALFVVMILGLAMVPVAALGPYFYALYLESKWEPARPKTKAELESYLHCYAETVINPKTSLWGWDYVLKPHERMVQYAILWSQPLDVVYDDKDRVVRIYTSYE